MSLVLHKSSIFDSLTVSWSLVFTEIPAVSALSIIHSMSQTNRLLDLDFRGPTPAEEYINYICNMRLYEVYPSPDLPNSEVFPEIPVNL